MDDLVFNLRSVLRLPFHNVQEWRDFNDVALRLLSLDPGGRQIRNALAQQDFNGAQLGAWAADTSAVRRVVVTLTEMPPAGC